MRKSLLFGVLMGLGILGIPIANAAGPFDGQWKGEGKPTSSCSDIASVTFTIKDSEFGGFTLTGPKGNATNVKGRTTDSGSATIEYGRSGLKGILQFEGNTFSGKMDSLCGMREVVGQRVG